MVWKLCFCYSTYRKQKTFYWSAPPPPVTKLILLHTVVVLHSTHHIIWHNWSRSECCQNAQKQFIIKAFKELILYKPVGKYQFTMACIRALAMIAYQVINYIISQPKHSLWVLKRIITMRRFFWTPDYRLSPMSKKICTILSPYLECDVYITICSYDTPQWKCQTDIELEI